MWRTMGFQALRCHGGRKGGQKSVESRLGEWRIEKGELVREWREWNGYEESMGVAGDDDVGGKMMQKRRRRGAA